MKKIMFNDRYGLTQAVLDRRKTQTRRIIPRTIMERVETFRVNYYNQTLDALTEIEALNQYFFVEEIGKFPYQAGEVVAVAQSYASIVDELEDPKNFCCMEHWESAAPKRAHYCGYLNHPGMLNKMFVSADEMPHRIRITYVRVERLQDISDEDCLAEGVVHCCVCLANCYLMSKCSKCGCQNRKHSPREAYAALIDKISGKGTWESNSYVFVYDFELVKD